MPRRQPVDRSEPPAVEPIMEDEAALRAWAKEVGSFDVVVGINCRNVETTIVHVLNVVCTGLQEQLPGMRALVVVCDGGSEDSTLPMARFFPPPIDTTKVVVKQLHGPGKGNGVRTVLEIAEMVDAGACACVDGDLVSIHPSWIGSLLNPILYGLADVVVPYYLRDKWDGVITNHLCYPFTAALYGSSVRQPIGGDYGLSRPFIRHVLDGDVPGDFGIDIHLTTTAIAEGFRTQEAPLGIKVHASTTDYTDPRKTLSGMYLEVVGTLLEEAGRYEAVWRHPDIRPPVLLSESVVPYYRRLPPPVRVDQESLREVCMEGVERHAAMLRRVLPDDLHAHIAEPTAMDAGSWARVVYALTAHHLSSGPPRRPSDEMLEALGALGMGRFLRFVQETQDMSLQEANDQVKEQAHVFMRHKPELVQRLDDLREEGIPAR